MLRRSRFNLTFENKLSCKMAKLIPVLSAECLPGDSFSISTDSLIRFAPLIAPVMHTVDVYFHYYFVPNRILWDNGKNDCWETFITGGVSGEEAPAHPYISFERTLPSALSDYLGVPSFDYSTFNTTLLVDALPFRAYDMIYNHWYRDQNLQEEVPISLTGGLDSISGTALLNRNWEKDYFTSAFPSPQRGTGVSIPLSGDAPIIGEGNVNGATTGNVSVVGNGKGMIIGTQGPAWYVGASYDPEYGSGTPAFFKIPDDSFRGYPSGAAIANMQTHSFDGDMDKAFGLSTVDPFGTTIGSMPVKGNLDLKSVKADMSGVSSVNISDLRKASAIQRWLEKSMRFGSRYVEQLMSFFGVRPRDSRLQIPEYIGGFKTPILFSEVLQTSSTSSTSPQGNMAGHGFGARIGKPMKYFCSEHGWLMGIMSIMPRTNYMQGLPRKLTRFGRYDYFFPDFQNIGEQEVKNKEIYAGTTAVTGDQVFGYQQRYAEYKMFPSEVHGAFKTSLDFWHLARKFDKLPNLNSDFVTAQPSTRIFADIDGDDDNVFVHINHHIMSKRPMAKFSKPSLR